MLCQDINAYGVIMLVDELHKQGYEQLRLLSGMSPNGCAWRWALYPKILMTDNQFEMYGDTTPFKSIYGSTGDGRPIIAKRPTLFQKHKEYLLLAKGSDKEYVAWFHNIVDHAQNGIYPIAYTDGSSEWMFTNGEKLSPPPFLQSELNTLTDKEIIRYALYGFDEDSTRELRYVLDFEGKKPNVATIANTIRQAIAEGKGLVSHDEYAQYKNMAYDSKDIINSKDIENGLLVKFKDGREIELIHETILVALGERRKQ